jgi:hypothetical protein
VPPCPITISPVSLTRGTLLVPYDQTITVSGGTPPYSVVVTGNTPPGLSAPLTLSGIPNAIDVYSFRVKVTDAQGCTAEKMYTIAIIPPLSAGAIVPTLSMWMLAMLVVGLALLAIRRLT